MDQIIPCLWFDNQAEEAVNFYISVFKDSKIDNINYYGEAGFENHKMKKNSVMSIGFQINGQSFLALNGGPLFKFNESVSFQVFCETQEEIDYYWNQLTSEGEESQCGWLKDKFGLSWQVVPKILPALLSDPARAERVTGAFMKMRKFDIEKLIRA